MVSRMRMDKAASITMTTGTEYVLTTFTYIKILGGVFA